MDPARLTVDRLPADPTRTRSVEFVERKGLGHPDTICDGVAEAVSRRLSRWYRDRFGRVLHHNTDSVQLVAGRAAPAFGGGEVETPIYLLLGGRATASVDGDRIPVHDLAEEAALDYLTGRFDHLDAAHVEVESRIGEAGSALRSLVQADPPLANDTSVGVGYAPLSETERIVRSLEPAVRDVGPGVGEDVKVMARGTPSTLSVTVAAAVVAEHVADVSEYVAVTERIADVARRHVRDRTDRDVAVRVNAADDPAHGEVYLTVTGLSAEMGDDGNVGRGNRANGVIAPYRPTSLEAVAGKNPVSHVGKLYNLVAGDAAARVTDELGADYAEVALLSRIGDPLADPQAAHVATTAGDDVRDAAIRDALEAELSAIESLTDDVIAGRRALF
ncbi:MAG: methionine adenosyltransferase [Haloferacaceae archaeon]